MQSATSSEQGLDEFLGHIRNRPSSEILVERFLDLVVEMSYDRRRVAMNKLLSVLLDANPHRALQSSYIFLQSLRNEGAPTEEEVAALEMTQTCFKKLGKENDASVVRDEINRLRGIRPGSKMVQQIEHLPPKHNATGGRDTSREVGKKTVSPISKDVPPAVPATKKDFPQSSFNKIGDDLFNRLKFELGNFPNIRHQKLAVETLIKSYQKVYEVRAPVIRQALSLYSRNPLIWTKDGKFRQELADYFLEGRLFSMGRDSLTEVRLRTCLEVLTSWFDQKLLVSTTSWEDMNLAQELAFLESTLLAILDKEI